VFDVVSDVGAGTEKNVMSIFEDLKRIQDVCKAYFNPSLTDDDRAWIAKQLELCGQPIPEIDVSWMNWEKNTW